MVFTACRPSTALYELHDWQNWKIEVEADRATTEEDSDKEYIMDELQQQEEDAPEEEMPDEVTAGVAAEEENTAERAILSLYDALELESSVAAALANPENAENTGDETTASDSLTGDNEDSDSVTPGGAVSEGGSTGTGSQGDGGGSLQLEDNNGEAEDPDIVTKPTHEQAEEDEEKDEENEDDENDDGGDEDDDKDLEIYDEETEETNEITTISGAGKGAAVGEAAVLVCMLDGVDRLCATSESLVENTLAQRAFPVDEDECAVLWSGDGGDALSEEDFQTLLDINPDMCFYLSGSSTFTNSQIARLKEAGIVVTSLPDLTTIDGIEKAVYNLGVVLGDEAQEKANDYLDWCADLESELSGLDEVDTIYI
ncbi:MAG: hypothetical protein LUE31_06930 [Lachnospiraceae bacterium]|nr:hypothetical protein [Lachnospiraceae bacterium]